jgi:hypothetical protein
VSGRGDDFDGLPEEMRLALFADASAQIAMEAGVVVRDCVVIDAASGAAGRVKSLYGDGSAYVVFPGGAGRMLQPWEMSVAEDQDWEPEGGWPE